MKHPLHRAIASAVGLVVALGLGCTAPAEQPAPGEAPAASAQEQAATAQARPAAEGAAKAGDGPKRFVAKKRKLSPAERKARNAIKWPTDIVWTDWNEARSQSAETGKPICLVVYADWCPRCKELAPVFTDPEIVEMSKKMIMVKQDHDARPDWMSTYADFGTYVPRIFFFGPDGNVRTDINSGNARYPYFYSGRGKTSLLGSMRAALVGG